MTSGIDRTKSTTASSSYTSMSNTGRTEGVIRNISGILRQNGNHQITDNGRSSTLESPAFTVEPSITTDVSFYTRAKTILTFFLNLFIARDEEDLWI